MVIAERKHRMKGYLIEKYENMAGAYTSNRLLLEAKKRNIELKMAGVEDTVIRDGSLYCGQEKLQEADFIINRYKYGVIKDELNSLAKRSYNSLAGVNRYINKASELMDMQHIDICLPKYIVAKWQLSYEELVSELGSPFVVKGLCGSQGNQVYLVEQETDYRNLKVQYQQQEMLFEEFIKESYGHDVRFLMIGGRVVACMERIAKEGFRSNFALGADVKSYPIDDRIREIAAAIYQKTELDIVGVDLLLGAEDYVFCEINVTPGIEGIERATQVNAAGQIMDYIYAHHSRV